jgi:transposase
MAEIERGTKRDPADLTGDERALIATLLLPPRARGRPRGTDRREVMNAIRTLARIGCG